MKAGRYLSSERLLLLFKKDFRGQWKDYLITMGGVCGAFLLILIIAAKTGTIDRNVHYGFMSILLFGVGIIFTSMAFKGAHKKLLNHDWLMLPASSFEKFLEKMLLHAVVFPVAAIAVYTVFTLFSRIVIQLFLREFYPWFNPFDIIIWRMVLHYIIAQSIFMLGAAWFRNNNLIKTIIALVVFSIILSILSALIGWIIFNDYFWVLVREDFNINFNISEGFYTDRLENFGYRVAAVMKIVYFVLLAPVCWTGAWLKLREVEVKDGV